MKRIASVAAVLLCVVALAVGGAHAFTPYTPRWAVPAAPVQVGTSGQSALYRIDTPAGAYDDPVWLVQLRGATRYHIGFDYGVLLGNASAENYHSLISFVSPNQLIQDVLIWFLDTQYSNHLVHQLPADMVDEIKGVNDGAATVGVAGLGDMMTRGLTLASIATGDVVTDIEYIIVDELFPPKLAAAHATDAAVRDFERALSPMARSIRARMSANKWTAHDVAAMIRADSGNLLTQHCSMFGAWGSRTANGDVLTGRNLDWQSGTGIAKHKVLAVYDIPGARVKSYVTVGFAGLMGALTGMSSAGVTVHEAGDDNKVVTLNGFAWSMRLRYVMENARDLAEATALWEATNNTLGLNHGIGSAADKQFLCLETKAGYTAYFGANDSREANTTVDGVAIGAPLPDAVWRTNHGYDPEFLRTVAFPLKAHSNSVVRYMLIHDTLALYESQGVTMQLSHALNISSVLGDKNDEQFTNCSTGSSNILSTAYDPAHARMFVAWENGPVDAHTGACCNVYLYFDMTQWFQTQTPAQLAAAAHADADADADAVDGADAEADAVAADAVQWKSAFHA